MVGFATKVTIVLFVLSSIGTVVIYFLHDYMKVRRLAYRLDIFIFGTERSDRGGFEEEMDKELDNLYDKVTRTEKKVDALIEEANKNGGDIDLDLLNE